MNSSPTIADWLKSSEKELKAVGVESARLDCLILLENALKIDRAYILAKDDSVLPKNTLKRLNADLRRRKSHEPIAYILKSAYFYGRQFFVDQDVLVPRPESEEIINEFKKLASRKSNPTVIDIGTGSGVLGITAALEVPGAKIDLLDSSKKALAVAKKNSEKYDLELKIIHGDLLSDVKNTYVFMLVNLPYVPESMTVSRSAYFEPTQAIYGGKDGLDIYRLFWQNIKKLDPGNRPGVVITETLPTQHIQLKNMAYESDYKLIGAAGFVQTFELNTA